MFYLCTELTNTNKYIFFYIIWWPSKSILYECLSLYKYWTDKNKYYFLGSLQLRAASKVCNFCLVIFSSFFICYNSSYKIISHHADVRKRSNSYKVDIQSFSVLFRILDLRQPRVFRAFSVLYSTPILNVLQIEIQSKTSCATNKLPILLLYHWVHNNIIK